MRCTKGFRLFLLPLIALALCPALSTGQADSAQEQIKSVVTGSLKELKDSRRVILMVRRSNVVDSRGQASAILKEVYSEDAATRVRYPRLFNLLARQLNNYMKRYQSITAVKDVSEADFIVLFNLIEYRRPLGFSYPYGEMFVILNNRVSGKPPQIVWKTRKSPVWAEDAIKDFIRELKAVRGEG
jgi:hypothetical protein